MTATIEVQWRLSRAALAKGIHVTHPHQTFGSSDDRLRVDTEQHDGQLLLSGVQVLLAEKRTSLALMRSGIAIIALPLTIASALIATSSFYDAGHVAPLLATVMTVNAMLLAVGLTLVARSYRDILKYDRLLHHLKSDHPSISPYLD